MSKTRCNKTNRSGWVVCVILCRFPRGCYNTIEDGGEVNLTYGPVNAFEVAE